MVAQPSSQQLVVAVTGRKPAVALSVCSSQQMVLFVEKRPLIFADEHREENGTQMARIKQIDK